MSVWPQMMASTGPRLHTSPRQSGLFSTRFLLAKLWFGNQKPGPGTEALSKALPPFSPSPLPVARSPEKARVTQFSQITTQDTDSGADERQDFLKRTSSWLSESRCGPRNLSWNLPSHLWMDQAGCLPLLPLSWLRSFYLPSCHRW